jgi:hypothetical protein
MNRKHAIKIHAELNARYFNGVLSMPKFIKFSGHLPGTGLNHNRFGVWGAYENNTIWYHRAASMQRLRFTIAHEMIHQYQDLVGWFRKDNGANGDALIYHDQFFWFTGLLMSKDGLKI